MSGERDEPTPAAQRAELRKRRRLEAIDRARAELAAVLERRAQEELHPSPGDPHDASTVVNHDASAPAS